MHCLLDGKVLMYTPMRIDRIRHYGSQMLGFESETLVDVPDQSQKMTYTEDRVLIHKN